MKQEIASGYRPRNDMLMIRLECSDVFLKAHDVTEFVHAVQQTSLIERVDREGERAAREGNGLGRQINCQLGARRFLRQIEEHLVSRVIHNDRNESVLQRVVAEDIREGG